VSVDPALVQAARAWMAADPDPETRAELGALLARSDEVELADRFAGRLMFGTAGLRGAMAAGPNRMNRAMVRLATGGVAHWLGTDVSGGVVIGCDARHHSEEYAVDAAGVFAAAGIRARMLPPRLPTPVTAFAVRHLGAAAGVMITASHNPPADNGYKLYARDGAQIVPPMDDEVAAAIDAFPSAADVAVSADSPLIEHEDADVVDVYLAATARLLVRDERDVRVAYTAMHGVGRDLAQRAFALAGFRPLVETPGQCDPDPDFPTVAFPNPEEPGAMDRVLALAAEIGADLVLANDPDADRLGVAIPDGATYRMLRGDEIGWLLADHLLRHTTGDERLVATTVVSSGLLERLAAEHHVRYAETLTGFKWIARSPDDRPGARFLFGYEEAIGYGFPTVRDKDGVAAALVMAELAAVAKAERRTLAGRLDDLARQFGLHVTDQWSLRVEGPGALDRLHAAMVQLRADPPGSLAGSAVIETRDLLAGDTGLPPSDVLVYRLEGGGRVVVRPSGTEPKLKVYFEVVEAVTAGVAEARGRARARIADLRADMQPRLSP
jgi:phosphomannomutase